MDTDRIGNKSNIHIENVFNNIQFNKMKKTILFFYIIFSIGLSAQELSIMTYNVKLDYPKEGDNSWTNRKPFFINQLKFYEPDILGVQEPMPNQMADMDSLLPQYKYVGVGRDDGANKGEYSAIFYKKDKFKILESSTFWLSKTPEKVSKGWDADCNRVCTYALFEDIVTGKKFWVFNTHFDHIGMVARNKSTILILKKIKEININDYPVILSGDFNMEESDNNIKYISEKLNDSKTIAKNIFGPTGTFNGFEFHEPVTRRIDFIFLSKDILVEKYAVLSDSKDCRYPSDHLPVYIKLLCKE